jgi:hypothetical protein
VQLSLPIRSSFASFLAHRYSFNDGTANDSTSGANGTLVGGATISGGMLNTNGTASNGVSLPLSAFAGIDGSFTIEDWATRTTTAGDFTTLFAFGSNSVTYFVSHAQRGENNFFTVEFDNGQSPGGGVSQSGDVGFPSDGSVQLRDTPMATATQTMIAASYDSSTDIASFYVNGTLLASSTITNGFDLASVASGGLNGVGGFDAYGDGSTPGTTDEFRIYSGIIGSPQIAQDAINGVSIVPEPTSIGLMLLIAVGSLDRRFRKISARKNS